MTVNPAPGQVLAIHTLGGFHLQRHTAQGQWEPVDPGAWGREKALHLFQFLVTHRSRLMHKEQIIDRLWPELDTETGDRDFKVALNAITKTLEPGRPPRSGSRFVRRIDLAYGLLLDDIWIDAAVFDEQISQGNSALKTSTGSAIACYRAAAELYRGEYLPERRFEDWTSAERERLHTLAMVSLSALAGLLVTQNPAESIRLCERVLAVEPAWEDVYRVLMRCYDIQGNRPMVVRTYTRCVTVLQAEFGLPPLPETEALYRSIIDV